MQTRKTRKDGSRNCLFSSIWLINEGLGEGYSDLNASTLPSQFPKKLSKPAWALKSLGEGRGYGSLPIKRCDFSKICSLS